MPPAQPNNKDWAGDDAHAVELSIIQARSPRRVVLRTGGRNRTLSTGFGDRRRNRPLHPHVPLRKTENRPLHPHVPLRKLKTARLGSFPRGRLRLLGLDGFYQLAAHRSCPLLPRAGMIGEKDMHACLSSRSYRAVQSFTGLPFDALLDSRVATGPRDGNTIYVCLMPATVARAAGAFGVTCYLLVDRCSALSAGAGSAGAVLRESREPAVRHVPAARSIPAG